MEKRAYTPYYAREPWPLTEEAREGIYADCPAWVRITDLRPNELSVPHAERARDPYYVWTKENESEFRKMVRERSDFTLSTGTKKPMSLYAAPAGDGDFLVSPRAMFIADALGVHRETFSSRIYIKSRGYHRAEVDVADKKAWLGLPMEKVTAATPIEAAEKYLEKNHRGIT